MFITTNLQCPTTIIPFFGDQFFWGSMVQARGLGAPPVPVEQLQLNSLVDAIKFMIDPKVNIVMLIGVCFYVKVIVETLANTSRPWRGGDLSYIYCRMAWSTSKLNTRHIQQYLSNSYAITMLLQGLCNIYNHLS